MQSQEEVTLWAWTTAVVKRHRWIHSTLPPSTPRESKAPRQELYVFLRYFECFNGTLGCNNSAPHVHWQLLGHDLKCYFKFQLVAA